jgi:hypothetical protein
MRTQVSTDLTEQLQSMFDAAQTTLQQREQRLNDMWAKRIAEEQAEISASWEQPMLCLTHALPEWIYPYIQQPNEEYGKVNHESHEREYTYVPIMVPGCNPIAAWVGHSNDVRFEVMEPHLSHDDEDNVWYVSDAVKWHRHSTWSIQQHGDPDIAVTLFRAHESYLKRLELVEQAEQRNDYEPETLLVDAPEPEPAQPDNVDKAGDLLAKYNAHLIDDATIVLAAQLYAIADQARRIANALEK